MLVSDRAVAQRLGGAGDDAIGGADLRDLRRWARAWLVCIHAHLVADGRYGLTDPWAIPLELGTVQAPGGGQVRGRRSAAFRLLCESGVLRAAGGAGVGLDVSEDVEFTVAEALFVEHQAALGLDWRAIISATRAEPAQLLVARAVADFIVPLDAFTAIPRRDLIERSGYQVKQTRVALRRLCAAGVLDALGEVGMTGRYRFAARALGRPWAAAGTTLGSGAAPREGPHAYGPERSASTAAAVQSGDPSRPVPAADATGLRLEVGGVSLSLAPDTTFRIGPGMDVRLEVGSDGVPTLKAVPRPGSS